MRVGLAYFAAASGLVATLVLIAWPRGLDATPVYSIRSASACDTCHIEPIGWYDPPQKSERKCTLDCQACHVSKTGGGMRTPFGEYFGHESLAMFGARPSAGTNPEKYRDPGNPSTKGRYRLWEGFSGWQYGKTPVPAISDRLGSIDPTPTWDVGADLRLMGYFPLGGEASFFPMQVEGYATARPFEHLQLYGTLGLQGSRDDKIASDPVTIRELFATVDGFDNNLYARIGRFTKPYGWRVPDHTNFTRAPLQQDQYAQVLGAEVGIAPNYPYANLALFYQGVDAWPGDLAERGYGAALSAGLRDLGWQVGASAELLRLAKLRVPDETRITAGPLWGVNLFPLAYLGELDLRATLPEGGADGTYELFAYHALDLEVTRGLSLVGEYEWIDTDLTAKSDEQHRFTAGLEVTPFTYTQVLLHYRRAYLGGTFQAHDTLLTLHFWL